jgi:hypothetical protein
VVAGLCVSVEGVRSPARSAVMGWIQTPLVEISTLIFVNSTSCDRGCNTMRQYERVILTVYSKENATLIFFKDSNKLNLIKWVKKIAHSHLEINLLGKYVT